MRCLLDMSCIDPLERRFDMTGLSGETMPDQALRDEADQVLPELSVAEPAHRGTHPQGYAQAIHRVSGDNKDVPSRFDANKRQGNHDRKLKDA